MNAKSITLILALISTLSCRGSGAHVIAHLTEQAQSHFDSLLRRLADLLPSSDDAAALQRVDEPQRRQPVRFTNQDEDADTAVVSLRRTQNALQSNTIEDNVQNKPSAKSQPPSGKDKAQPYFVQAEKEKVEKDIVGNDCASGGACELRLQSFDTSSPLFQYAYAHSTPLDTYVRNVIETTQSISLPGPVEWRDACATPETLALAAQLLRVLKPNRSLVVGVFTGAGAVAAARGTNADGLVLGVDKPENRIYWDLVGAKYATSTSRGMARISFRFGAQIPQTLEELKKTEPMSFDFIFLDDYEQQVVLSNYEKCVGLLRHGGLMLITNTLGNGRALQSTANDAAGVELRRLNSALARDTRVDVTLLPFGGGTTIVFRK